MQIIESHHQIPKMKTMLGLLMVASLMLTETSATSTNNELTCTICVDIVTEIGDCFKNILKLQLLGSLGRIFCCWQCTNAIV